MNDSKLVWSDELGDLRKAKKVKAIDNPNVSIDEKAIVLKIRRMTSGKGRTAIEITGLPTHKKWCQKLAKELKKSLAVGGAYKDNVIEIHGEKIAEVTKFLDEKSLKWKKTGG